MGDKALREAIRRSVAHAEPKKNLIDRIEELEANINIKADFIDATINQLAASDQRIEELEAKLAKAIQALELALDFADNDLVDFDKYGLSCDADINERYRTTIAELSSVSCANLKG